ncbi:hypothetical protein ACLOJK_026297 [Asimina triloba]
MLITESKKVTCGSSSSDVEQSVQLPEYEEGDPIEDLLKDSPSHSETLMLSSQVLIPSAPILMRLGSSKSVTQAKFSIFLEMIKSL